MLRRGIATHCDIVLFMCWFLVSSADIFWGIFGGVRLLEEFVEKYGDGLAVIYSLSGWLKNNPTTYHIRLVPKDMLSGDSTIQILCIFCKAWRPDSELVMIQYLGTGYASSDFSFMFLLSLVNNQGFICFVSIPVLQ